MLQLQTLWQSIATTTVRGTKDVQLYHKMDGFLKPLEQARRNAIENISRYVIGHISGVCFLKGIGPWLEFVSSEQSQIGHEQLDQPFLTSTLHSSHSLAAYFFFA